MKKFVNTIVKFISDLISHFNLSIDFPSHSKPFLYIILSNLTLAENFLEFSLFQNVIFVISCSRLNK